MLEYLYVCCLCVLIIPLVTRAWHAGNPRHVTCRVYIDMHPSVCILYSCHVNWCYLSFNLIWVFCFKVSMSLFGHVVCFAMWSVLVLWSNFCQSQNFFNFSNGFNFQFLWCFMRVCLVFSVSFSFNRVSWVPMDMGRHTPYFFVLWTIEAALQVFRDTISCFQCSLR